MGNNPANNPDSRSRARTGNQGKAANRDNLDKAASLGRTPVMQPTGAVDR